MSIFDKPLSGGKKKSAAPPAQESIRLRPAKLSDAPALAEIERLGYTKLVKDSDGKFTNKLLPQTDSDFEVDVVPAFCMEEAKLTKFIKQTGGNDRIIVAAQGDTVVGCCIYTVDNTTSTIDVALILLHPKTNVSELSKFEKLFQGMADLHFKETNLVYDCPDALDTPTQRLFQYFSKNGWSYKLKRNVFVGNVDAWRFKRKIYPSKGPKKGPELAESM